jgi:hypothetical protein
MCVCGDSGDLLCALCPCLTPALAPPAPAPRAALAEERAARQAALEGREEALRAEARAAEEAFEEALALAEAEFEVARRRRAAAGARPSPETCMAVRHAACRLDAVALTPATLHPAGAARRTQGALSGASRPADSTAHPSPTLPRTAPVFFFFCTACRRTPWRSAPTSRPPAPSWPCAPPPPPRCAPSRPAARWRRRGATWSCCCAAPRRWWRTPRRCPKAPRR